jgi:hypothetical protein
LLALLEQVHIHLKQPIPDEVQNSCVVLNPYAVEIRYPDDGANPTLEDSKEARQSEVACAWVRNLIVK